MNLAKILFFCSMIFGSLITISSYSWLSMWMGLEINLLSIIPLLSNIKNIYPSEAALKYFITQAMASSILLMSIILTLNSSIIKELSTPLMMIFNSAILTKMGAAPFHFWFPEVMEGLNWMNNLIMMTWQKIAPMIILSYSKMILMMMTIIMMSIIMGSILGLNQTSLRKIMAFSSISHMGWMIASMMMSSAIWILYFTIYSFLNFSLILLMKNLNLFNTNQLFMIFKNQKQMKIIWMLNLFSLGGLPPFLGFIPKWMTLNILVENFKFLSIMMVSFTLMTLFFYMRLSFSTWALTSYETNLNLKNKITNQMKTLMILSSLSLILMPLMLWFL